MSNRLRLRVAGCEFQVYNFGSRGSIYRTRQGIKKQHGSDKSAPYKMQQTFYTFLIGRLANRAIGRLVDFKVLNLKLWF